MEFDSIQRRLSSSRSHSKDSTCFSIRGMESVVATVSGYHGSDRFKLIKLISQTGASYVGAMSRSTTHLVCWKLEGRKYHLAKKFKTLIVNHRWVEECIKQGKRVPEHPYILRSGQEVGPLLLEVPLVAESADVLLSEQPNKQNGTKNVVIDLECEETGDVVWTDSCLLDKNLFPDVGTSKRSHKLKKRRLEKISRQDYFAGSSNCFQEPHQSDIIRREHAGRKSPPSREGLRLVRQKRTSTPSIQPSREGRRLVKNIRNKGRRNENILTNWSNSDNESSDSGGNRNEGLEDAGERENRSDALALEDSYVFTEEAPTSPERTPQDQHFDADKSLNKSEDTPRLPTSTELSCVICWTDFSSTRGILPCGHRFCFSCIQSWADHMASRRKISTCPLCKASFVGITKVDDAVSSDQKIYSQTIPFDPSTTNIFILSEGETPAFGAQASIAPVCSECCYREPEDLLVRCHICHIRCIHSYCLDPPLFPWTCLHCKDLRMLYNHMR